MSKLSRQRFIRGLHQPRGTPLVRKLLAIQGPERGNKLRCSNFKYNSVNIIISSVKNTNATISSVMKEGDSVQIYDCLNGSKVAIKQER